jgi:A/G-specific adenine glycosylase
MLFTARHIQEDLGGRFPDSFEKVLKLKGVGEYTAACIVSICFGEAQAAVDGNVYRVLSRYFADPIPIDSPAGKKHFRQLAQNLISTARPGDFNEAMMDLGAMICKPRNPECGLCPIQRSCIAMERQVQYAFPVKAPARVRPVTVMNYLIARTDGRIQIRQRSGTGIWKGLYELPLVTGDCSEQQILEACKNIYGLKVNSIIPVKNVRHQLSHTILDIRFFDAGVVDSVNKQDDTLLEVPESEVGRYPFPKPLVDYLGELNLPES